MSHCGLGLSCEPIKDQYCSIHKSHFVSFNGFMKCPECNWEQRPKPSLEDQIKALTDMYKSVSIQCAANHEHKLRQIDENRKISRRIDELFETLEAYNEDAEYLDSLSLPKRIEKLEELNQQCFEANPIKAIYDKFEKIESKIACLMQKSTLNDEKRPFKCPVCSGEIKILIDPATPMSGIQAMFGKRDENGMYYKECNACNGKGIVWG